ncbi:S-methyl-5-thioribose-1-phosphate isomerase [Gryganskiella cystojenkinii]|nr:S-methyl-5-thioribose-1-phosphate isomerase [Gryganskiella cystojenkinii]
MYTSTNILSPVAGQETCTGQVCITATIFSKEPNLIEFSLVSKLQVGWLGLGVGGLKTGMTGNDLAICWPTPTGQGAVISQRGATANGQPDIKPKTVAFSVQSLKSQLVSKIFTCTFSRPLNLSTSPIPATATTLSIIYAVGLTPVSGVATNPQGATLVQHDFQGTATLNIARKDGTSSSTIMPTTTQGGNSTGGTPVVPQVPNPTDNTDDGIQESTEELLARVAIYQKLLKAHGIMMATAFLLFFPTGALLARFFSHRESIFMFHRPIQVTGFITVIAAFICIIVAVYKKPSGPQPASSHSTIGFFLVLALFLQVAMGIFIFHAYDPERDPRTKTAKAHRIFTWGHKGWAYVVLLTGLAQVDLGIEKYGAWPLKTESIWYVYYVLIGIWVAVFVFGSAFKLWQSRWGQKSVGSSATAARREGERDNARSSRVAAAPPVAEDNFVIEGPLGPIREVHDSYDLKQKHAPRQQQRSIRRQPAEEGQYDLRQTPQHYQQQQEYQQQMYRQQGF